MKKNIVMFILALFLMLPIGNVYAASDKNPYEDMVENILLIGEDGVKGSGASRSDAMIILTVNNLNKSLKLTSLTRDTLVKIPGRGYEKLNHAYAYGGVDLLLETISENFGININDYAIVNFNSFIEVVNIIGGVDINVEESEITHLNKIIKACYGIAEDKNKDIEYVTSSGSQNLNGYQALAYARIRKIDTIYNRDERQRQILTSVAKKLSNTSITKYPTIVKSVIRYVDVNIAFNKLIKLALNGHELGSYEIEQLEFPKEEYREEKIVDGHFVVDWDKEKNINILKSFIYGN